MVEALRRRQIGNLAAMLLLGTLVFHGLDLCVPGLLDRTGRLKAPDFLQFYTYGSLVRSGAVNRLYEPKAHAAAARQIDPQLALSDFRPNYSPVVAWLSAPLAALTFLQAMAAFSVASVAAYVSAVMLLGSATSRFQSRGLMALVAAAWPTLFIVLRYGQISALSLLLLAGAAVAAARRRDMAAGILLGLLAYKPQLLLAPLLALLALRQWRLLVGVSLGAGAELLLDLMLVGPAMMRQYVEVLIGIARQPELVQFFAAESHSLRGFVRLLLPWPWLLTTAGLMAVPVAAWAAVRVWRRHSDWRPRWAALVVAALLASPHLLTYDLLLLAVPLVLLADWLIEAHGDIPRGAWRWVLALLYFGAWPGVFIARLYQVQLSTVGMLMLLWLLATAPRAGRA